MQSRTLFTTINTQLSIRSFGPLGIGLIMIWVLSPLGSQSCLRIFTTGLQPRTKNQTISYVDTMTNEMFSSVNDNNWFTSSLDPMYVASILSPQSVKNSSMDLWGNVKIPYLSNSNVQNNNEWTLISDPAPEPSSLLGIPLGSLESGNTTLLLESTYIGLDCSAPEYGSKTNVVYVDNLIPNNGVPSGTFWSIDITSNSSSVHTSSGYPPTWIVATDVSFPGVVVGLAFQSAANLEFNQSRLLFQSPSSDSTGNSSNSFISSYCGLKQVYVESNVTCSLNDGTQKCAVKAQRPSQSTHPSSNFTILSLSYVFANFTSRWISATGALHPNTSSTFTEYYLQNTSSSSILNTSSVNENSAYLGKISAADFSQRLGQLLNTYMLGSQISTDVAGVTDIHEDAAEIPKRNTTATLTQLDEIYLCSWPWFAVLILASSVMLVASVLAIWWELQTCIPDILGYCSSLTRDAPYLNLKGGSTLDGMERTRLLKDYQITLGVIDGDKDHHGGVGHIAVVPAEWPKKPARGKLYA